MPGPSATPRHGVLTLTVIVTLSTPTCVVQGADSIAIHESSQSRFTSQKLVVFGRASLAIAGVTRKDGEWFIDRLKVHENQVLIQNDWIGALDQLVQGWDRPLTVQVAEYDRGPRYARLAFGQEPLVESGNTVDLILPRGQPLPEMCQRFGYHTYSTCPVGCAHRHSYPLGIPNNATRANVINWVRGALETVIQLQPSEATLAAPPILISCVSRTGFRWVDGPSSV